MEPKRVTSEELLKLVDEHKQVLVYVPVFFRALPVSKGYIRTAIQEDKESKPRPDYVVEFLDSGALYIS